MEKVTWLFLCHMKYTLEGIVNNHVNKVHNWFHERIVQRLRPSSPNQPIALTRLLGLPYSDKITRF